MVDRIAFRSLRAVLRAVVLSFLKVQVRGLERLTAEGPLLLVGNHPTIVDGLLLALLAPRKVRFVAARELLSVPGLGALLRWLGAIPAGEGTVDAACRALHKGHLVVIFPEGRTTNGEAVLPFRSGASRIAAASGVEIVPFAFDGTQHVYPHGARFARPSRVHLNLGDPLQKPDPEQLRSRVEELWLECRTEPRQAWSLGAAAAGLVVIPLSLVATLLHLTSSARRLVRRMEEDAR